MSSTKKVLTIVIFLFIGMQFIRPSLNTRSRDLETDISKTYEVPGEVLKILNIACYDCHSDNTRYPWYANIQPFGWLLAGHIKKGKEQLNFNEFGALSLRRQMSKLKGIENSLTEGSMPPYSYTLIHNDARLSKNEKNLIIGWLHKISDSLSVKN